MPTWADLYGGEYEQIPDEDYPEAYLDSGPIYPDQIPKSKDSIFGKVIDGKLIEPLKQPKNQPIELQASPDNNKQQVDLRADDNKQNKNQNKVVVKKQISKSKMSLVFGQNRANKNSNEI